MKATYKAKTATTRLMTTTDKLKFKEDNYLDK